MNTLILMAGVSSDFEQNGYAFPKYLIEIGQKPIIQRIIESLELVSDKITCLIRKEDQDKYFLGDTLKILSKKCNILEIPGDTKGAVCSALFAIDDINNDNELLLLNGDQLIKANIKDAIDDFRRRKCDAGIITMEAVNPKYSSILLDNDNFVIQTSEKRPISNIASTGCSYYKKGSDFVESCFKVIEKDVNVNGQYYISATFNEMVLKHKKIGIHMILKKDYISFANYQMFQNYISSKER